MRDVSRETAQRLQVYDTLLRKWNPKINLVAPGTLADSETRHFADSAQLIDLMPEGARSWLDLGSGGGFPGLVVAILAAETRPNVHVTLVEADQRKATFLRQVARETGVSVTVHARRIEDIPHAPVDVVSARALAPLARLLGLCQPFCHDQTVCLFPKGARHAEELSQALDRWRFTAHTVPSRTDPDAAILVLKDIHHVV